MIRAKFRCLSCTHTWENIWSYRLAPVMAKTGHYKDDPAASEENARFWKATPSGEIELYYRGSGPFVPGAFYYVDMSPVGDGIWPLESLLQRDTSLTISFQHWAPRGEAEVSLRSGKISMQIENEAAWAPFVESGAGSAWNVHFIRVEGT